MQYRTGDRYESFATADLVIKTKAPPEPTPNSCGTLNGVSDGVSQITLTWSQPSNWQSGWYYRVWRGSTIIKSSTTNTYYTHTPPSPTTTYTYKVACYNSQGKPGPYSYYTGKVATGGFGFAYNPIINGSLTLSQRPPSTSDSLLLQNETIDYQTYMQNLTYPLEITNDSLTLSWFYVPNATRYELVVYDVLKTMIYNKTTTTTEHQTITGLQKGSGYWIVVRAFDNDSRILGTSNEQYYHIRPYIPEGLLRLQQLMTVREMAETSLELEFDFDNWYTTSTFRLIAATGKILEEQTANYNLDPLTINKLQAGRRYRLVLEGKNNFTIHERKVLELTLPEKPFPSFGASFGGKSMHTGSLLMNLSPREESIPITQIFIGSIFIGITCKNILLRTKLAARRMAMKKKRRQRSVWRRR